MIMIRKILKTEVIGEENGTYKINCLLDNSVHSIDCSVVIDDEFGTIEGTDEIDARTDR